MFVVNRATLGLANNSFLINLSETLSQADLTRLNM